MARIISATLLRAGAIALAALLGGCATTPGAPPLAIAPTAPPAIALRPTPPSGASVNQTIPPRAPDGTYRTVNSGLSPAAAIWHVRSALNVAALGCRGTEEATIIANYNALLASKKTLLKTAFAQTEAEARKLGGTDWRDTHDRQMTQTYNFFAQPPAKERFCIVAATVVAEAAAIPPMEFSAFAAPALARLEAPFIDFYRAYDVYRRDLAAWEARDGSRTALVSAPSPRPLTAAPAAATPRAVIRPPAVAGSPAGAVRAPAPAASLTYAPPANLLTWSPTDPASDSRLAAAELNQPVP